MLLFSTRSDYATVLLASLAKRKGFISLRTIATKEKLPYRYIARLAGELKKAKFIESREGINGGYKLSRKPSQIRLKDVIELFEGPFALTRCQSPHHTCPRNSVCRMRPHWTKVHQQMADLINRYTLQDFL